MLAEVQNRPAGRSIVVVRRVSKNLASTLLASAVFTLLALTGCGGGGSSITTPISPPPPAVHNEWTWQGGTQNAHQTIIYGTLGVAAATNNPGGRVSGVSWTDSSGTFWLFGGLADPGLYGDNTLNDLWKFNNGQWTWAAGPDTTGGIGVYGALGTPGPDTIPGSRFAATSWKDSSGNIWLFGGNGYDSSALDGITCLNDLWKFSNSQWAWMSGPTVATGAQSGVYGTLGTPSTSNIPGGRMLASGWTDSSGSLWLFGGMTFGCRGDNGATNYLNDLWKFNNGQWAWEGGSSSPNQPGVYGTQGTPAPLNVPGARYGAATWTDAQGAFWLFGGEFHGNATASLYNDLWKYSDGQWTWEGGSSSSNQSGVYGTETTASPSSIPGSRAQAVTWVDASGNLWLFGGYGYDSTGNFTALSDLWKYRNSQWTWVSGPNLGAAIAIYGVQGVASTTNIPGARAGSYSWIDQSNNLWLYGGNGYAGTAVDGYLSDLWEYQP